MHNIIAQELVSAVERNTHSALRYIPNLKVKDLKINGAEVLHLHGGNIMMIMS